MEGLARRLAGKAKNALAWNVTMDDGARSARPADS
jgi:hypothetical protein